MVLSWEPVVNRVLEYYLSMAGRRVVLVLLFLQYRVRVMR